MRVGWAPAECAKLDKCLQADELHVLKGFGKAHGQQGEAHLDLCGLLCVCCLCWPEAQGGGMTPVWWVRLNSYLLPCFSWKLPAHYVLLLCQ